MRKLVGGGGGRLGLATTLVVLATWLSAGPGFATPQNSAKAEPRAVANEVIVGFRRAASGPERERALDDVDARVKRRLPGVGAVLVRVPGSIGPAIDRLERRSGVRYAEPNFRLFAYSHGSMPNDPEFHRLWGLHNFGQVVNFSIGTPDADIDATEAWGVTTGGSTVVGVIDTGIDLGHPDLTRNLWTNAGENCSGCRSDGVDNDRNGYVDDWRGWDFANSDNDPSDDNGHGTHVAGTIGAEGDNGRGVAGVNWSVQLMPLKFIGGDGSGTTADAIAALVYAIDNGAAVTNNSYGGGEFSQAFSDAVALADKRGSLFVAAAGNSFRSNDTTPQYPSSFGSPNVVSVAASTNTDQRAWFSNYGAKSVDLAAPGDAIYSTWPGGSYDYLSGTSMAAPQVAGAAALVRAAFPGATAAGIKALLLRTVDANASLAGKTTSGGRLNLNSAVRCSGAGQAWIESPGPGFVAMAGDEVRVTALAGSCGRPGGVTVTATANGAPITLAERGDGVYDGTYAPTQDGPLSISVAAEAPGGADTQTVSGRVPTTIAGGGSPVTVRAANPGDDPLLAFNGTAGQRVSLQLSGISIGTSSCCGTKVSITAPDGATLVAPAYFGTTGGFVDTKTLPQSGTYTILVDPQGTATGSATLTLYDVPADVTATIVPGGSAASVVTTTPGQNGTLSFDGSSGERVSVKVGPVCCSAKVSIVAPDGSTLSAPSYVSSSGGFIDTKTLPQTGRYTILVDHQGTATGSATVTLHDVPPDATATISPGGPAVSVTTTTPGQNARLAFSGTAGRRVSLKVGPTCCSAYVSILAPDGSTLGSPSYMISSGGFIDPKALPQTGTYTILVDHQGTATGSATVTLHDVPPDATATISPGGPAVSVTTTTPGQNARLAFSGTAGRRVSLKVGPTCCSAYVSILAPDGSTLGSPSYMISSGGFIDTKTLPQTGTYIVLVDPQAAASGSATLTLYDVPPNLAGTISIGGSPLTLTTTTPGQNATVTFDGSAGRTITLQISGVTMSQSKLAITNPDGSNLVPVQYVFTSGRTLTAELPANGVYTIFVDPVNAYVGSMTLALP